MCLKNSLFNGWRNFLFLNAGVLVLKAHFSPRWSWVHRLHFITFSVLEYIGFLLIKLMTHVKSAQVVLGEYSFSPSLFSAVISFFQTPYFCARELSSVAFIFLPLFLCGFISGEILQKLSSGKTNQQQILSFPVCTKNIIQNDKTRKSWSAEGIEKVQELSGKSLLCLLLKLLVGNDSTQIHTF